MAGVVLRVLPKTVYNFSNLSATNKQGFFAREFDAQQYREGLLQVRVHALTTSASDQRVDVKIFTVAPTEEDPGKMFLLDSAVATVTVDETTPPSDIGTLLTSAFASNFGGRLLLLVEGKQGASEQALTATISADVVLKE